VGTSVPAGLPLLLETNAGTGAVPVPLKPVSVSMISVNVTLPVLVTVNVQVIVLPSVASTPVFTNDNDGICTTSVSVGSFGSGVPGSSESSVTGSPFGSSPAAVAWLLTLPLFRSVCVTVWVTVMV